MNMNKNLEKILISSYSNSEYYRRQYDRIGMNLSDLLNNNNFGNIPILSRQNITNEYENILHREYRYLKRKSLHLIKTSGSSGHFVEVLWKPNEYLQSNLCLWRLRNKWYNISPASRKCSFVSGTIVGSTISANYNSEILRDRNQIELSIIDMSESVLIKYYKAIEEFKPEWIYASPSSLVIFVDFCRKYSLDNFPCLRYVELATEQVLPSTYKYISEFFNVPTAVMYGSKEVNGIALTCPYDNTLHVIEDNVYVEQTEDNRILVTSLKNTIFPIIRYDLGDLIDMDLKKHQGVEKQVIKTIKGRASILNYVSKTTGVTTEALVNCIYVVDALLDYPIIQYKMIDNDNALERTIQQEFERCFDYYGINKKNIKIYFFDAPFEVNSKTHKLSLVESKTKI